MKDEPLEAPLVRRRRVATPSRALPASTYNTERVLRWRLQEAQNQLALVSEELRRTRPWPPKSSKEVQSPWKTMEKQWKINGKWMERRVFHMFFHVFPMVSARKEAVYCQIHVGALPAIPRPKAPRGRAGLGRGGEEGGGAAGAKGGPTKGVGAGAHASRGRAQGLCAWAALFKVAFPWHFTVVVIDFHGFSWIFMVFSCLVHCFSLCFTVFWVYSKLA